MEDLEYEGIISIPQAKALFGRGIYIDNSIYLVDSISSNHLPQNKKECKCIVIIICEQGKFRFETNGKTIFAGANDILLLTRGQQVRNYKILSGIFKAKAILIDEKEIFHLANGFCNVPCLLQRLKETNKITLNSKEMDLSKNMFEQTTYNIIDKTRNKANKHNFAIHFTKIILHNALAKLDIHTNNTQNKHWEIFYQFCETVRLNFTQHLSIAEYCQLLHVKESQLERIVKDFLGISPIEYVHKILINYICIVAECTSAQKMPIKAIATRTHFSNQASFSRFVKKSIKMSLSKYRSLTPVQQSQLIDDTILDQRAVLADLPRTCIREDLVAHLF